MSEHPSIATPHSCCPSTLTPAAQVPRGLPTVPVGIDNGLGRHAIEQRKVPGGSFLMGEGTGVGHAADGETLVHRVDVSAFEIDATAVTNGAFAKFVDATGYVTEAETLGYSAVFHLAFAGSADEVVGRPAQTPWWLGVRGASWRHPRGARSGLEGLGDHPVVHVSWNDAQAYCAWAGRRLPTEAEWEKASRGGLDGARFPWGNELLEGGKWRCNIWQGTFPTVNTTDDGYLTTAPVRSYRPNALGLWQTVGNVWEWCADWFSASYYGVAESIDPPGPAHGTARVMRGGSFLCHESYCNRYRNAARTSNTPDSSMANAGFRTVTPRGDQG
jgi:formylglycine-generating enzyme required for sulfatase activity